MNGTLIVIDGLDGSGKQTQARLLRERLERERVPVRAISFPRTGPALSGREVRAGGRGFRLCRQQLLCGGPVRKLHAVLEG